MSLLRLRLRLALQECLQGSLVPAWRLIRSRCIQCGQPASRDPSGVVSAFCAAHRPPTIPLVRTP